ncbi:hypothetical protein BH11BAC5_BH11BAC5_29980 [soil metagenome]
MLINQFSTHLFWDVQKQQLDPEKSKDYIIKRVLEYGLYKDWLLLQDYYGIERIKDSVMGFRELEPKALNMVAILSNTPRENFRCYNTTRLTNPHWNF